MQKIGILLADDHSVIRAGLLALLSAEPDMEVIGQASNGFDAVRKTFEHNPDVVVMDVTMPGMDGLEALRQIKAKCPNVHVLVLTIHEERRYLHQFLQAGASGYFVKHAEPAELVAGIRAAARGKLAVHEPMLQQLVASSSEPIITSNQHNLESLTYREQQVMHLLVHGYTNKEIAERLHVSNKTVETHRSHVFAKLDVNTRAELVRLAIRYGLLGSDK